MESSFTTAVSTNKRLWAVLLIVAALLLFMKMMSAAGVAQSEERVLKADIPEHLPIKVKMAGAREQGFKRLDNERWLRDFELEVTNTGDKPIYYVYLLVKLPETKTYLGTTLMYPLYYGRKELSDIEIKAESDDVPIKPGETHVFSIHRGQVMAWEKAVREKNRPQATLVELTFQKLSFGDKSGYGGSNGQKVPHPPYKRSALSRCDDQPNTRSPDGLEGPVAQRVSIPEIRVGTLPASPLPVDLFSTLLTEPSQTLDLDCCPGVGCSYLTFSQDVVCYNCPDQNRIQNKSCSFEFGFCLNPTFGSIECYLDNGEPYLCQAIDLIPCATPTPTPTPTPSPCNCTDPNAHPADCSTGTPRCPIGEEAQSGCCYRLACDEPRPEPAACPPGYFPTRWWQDFPTCAWGPCIPLPPGGGGGCMESPIREEKSLLKDPSLLIMNPNCCDDYERISCMQGGGNWYEASCTCASPIVIDVAGNGFNLTNAANGVMFDLARTGAPERFSWTAANSDDAWLVFDRNGNGLIDDGKELFGSSTPQPYLARRETKNGFRALALFDTSAYGGNDDGQIDRRDSVFYSLKLWQDRNHNGVSEAGELQNLSVSVIRVIELDYKQTRRKDENGNWFRYRARVRDERGAQAGRWAWDVFLQKPD